MGTTASRGEYAGSCNCWNIANYAHYYADDTWRTSTNAVRIRVRRKSKPRAADETVTIGEETDQTFGRADSNFSDADGDELQKFRITDLFRASPAFNRSPDSETPTPPQVEPVHTGRHLR